VKFRLSSETKVNMHVLRNEETEVHIILIAAVFSLWLCVQNGFMTKVIQLVAKLCSITKLMNWIQNLNCFLSKYCQE